MQVASIGSVAPTRPSMPAPTFAPAAPQLLPDTPAWNIYTKHGHDILRMPGVKSMRIWGADRPNELGIVAVDERAAAAIWSVLEPVVGGATFHVFVGDSQEPYTGPTGRFADYVGIIDALPGIWNHKGNIMPRGSGTMTFHAVNQAVIDRLDPLLKDRWNLGVDKNGWTLWVKVAWKASCRPRRRRRACETWRMATKNLQLSDHRYRPPDRGRRTRRIGRRDGRTRGFRA